MDTQHRLIQWQVSNMSTLELVVHVLEEAVSHEYIRQAGGRPYEERKFRVISLEYSAFK
jgi:flavin reductase (DIM6/NTAB) family NADH-FMN oxidoreductase RutF